MGTNAPKSKSQMPAVGCLLMLLGVGVAPLLYR